MMPLMVIRVCYVGQNCDLFSIICTSSDISLGELVEMENLKT